MVFILNSTFYILNYKAGGLAQLARAPDLHSGGQGFDSLILHVSSLTRLGNEIDDERDSFSIFNFQFCVDWKFFDMLER